MMTYKISKLLVWKSVKENQETADVPYKFATPFSQNACDALITSLNENRVAHNHSVYTKI